MAYLLEHDKKDVSKYISRDHSCHFGFGIIFGLIAGVVGSMVEKQQSVETVESSSEADRVQEEATEEEETQKTPQEIAAIKTYVEAGVMIVFLAILLWECIPVLRTVRIFSRWQT